MAWSKFGRRQFTGHAIYTAQLSAAGMSASASTFALQTGQGSTFPDGSGGSFVVTVDPNTAAEEKVLCVSRTGDVFTVDTNGRAWDTNGGGAATGSAHSGNASVLHTLSAVDLDEANQAVVNTIGKVTTAGDMLVGSGANALSRVAAIAKGGLWVSTGVGSAPVWLPAGSDGHILAADSTQTDGVKWAQTAVSDPTEPADPTGTVSTTGVMMGLGASWTITPAMTGRVVWIVQGDLEVSTANTTAQVKIAFGTGSAPANGAAPTGTIWGTPINVAPANSPSQQPFSMAALHPGLTVGTAYWLDLILLSDSGSVTASLHQLNAILFEV